MIHEERGTSSNYGKYINILIVVKSKRIVLYGTRWLPCPLLRYVWVNVDEICL